MTHTLERIVGEGLCIGCGLCKSIAGQGNIEMVMNAEGGERPVVTGTVDEPTLRLINTVCPGLRVEGYVHETSVEAAEEAPEIHPIWGPTRRMFTGHATDPAVRFHASSGGALSALGLYLLETGAVDFILHVAASKTRPARTVDHLSFDAAQVIEGSGSRYGPPRRSSISNMCWTGAGPSPSSARPAISPRSAITPGSIRGSTNSSNTRSTSIAAARRSSARRWIMSARSG